MKIYVTRHGRTQWNESRLVSGVTDLELLDEGRRQARELGEQMRQGGIAPDFIIASPLQRAQETARLVASCLGDVAVLTDERLRERDFGRLEGTSYDDEAFVNGLNQMAMKLGGGESVLALAQRLYNLLDELPVKYAGKTLLLVGHGAVCRVIHSYFHSLTNEAFSNVRTGNCQLREYSY